MAATEVGAVVVGAGVAGLAAALELQPVAREVLVLDASDRPGGVLRTDHTGGYLIERGPNTVQVKPPLLAFLRGLGLEESLAPATPASRLRFIFRDGRLEPVPLSPLAFARTPLLSTRGKIRLLAELLIPRGDGGGESVAEFVGRRLGREASENLVGPFLTGVYAGDESELGAEAVFGTLVDMERSHRSLALGLAAGMLRRRKERGLRGTWSAPQGLGPFARLLAERLAEPPALGARATALRREGSEWLVAVESPAGETLMRTRRVVLATPAREAAELLDELDPDLAHALRGIDYAPIVSVSLGVDPEQVESPIEGFGFLVPRDGGLELLGCLFMSRLFPERAPEGRQLLQCMLGGRRWPEVVNRPDDLILERLLRDLDRSLGLRGEPQVLGVTRWPRAIPQPDRDHVSRIAYARSRLAELPGLALAGAYLEGVSVSDTVASGLRAARDLSQSATAPTQAGSALSEGTSSRS